MFISLPSILTLSCGYSKLTSSDLPPVAGAMEIILSSGLNAREGASVEGGSTSVMVSGSTMHMYVTSYLKVLHVGLWLIASGILFVKQWVFCICSEQYFNDSSSTSK